MAEKRLSPDNLEHGEDWVGNNAAFTCPHCGKVFLVSRVIHRSGRQCPSCKGSQGICSGGARSGGQAKLIW